MALDHLSVSHPCFFNHGYLSHPENSKRLSSIIEAFQLSEFRDHLNLNIERQATISELSLVHKIDYIQNVLEKAGTIANLDEETFLTEGSVKAALTASGIGLELVEKVVDGKVQNGFALLRPPGHHAISNSAMGFCVFNNIAIAAKNALAKGVKKILIIDFDVHHGNGTEEVFYEDERVLFIDLHQDNLFPVNSGAIEDIGRGKGFKYTINIPLNSGCSDGDYLFVFDELIIPAVRKFQPELILVSAGFDAHESDPLGGMRLTTNGYALITKKIKAIAEELCFGKVVFFLEGGYHPYFLAHNVLACVKVLATKNNSLIFTKEPEPEMHNLKNLLKRIYEQHCDN